MESEGAWDRAERLTKLSASVFVAVYVLGFLITSLYYSTLGIAPISVLKPRVIGAGILFTSIVAIAYWAGITAFRDFLKPGPEKSENQLIRVLIDSCLLVVLCSCFRFTLGQLTDFGLGAKERVVLSFIVPVLLFTVGFTIWRIESFSLQFRSVATSIAMLLSLTSIGVTCFWPPLQQPGAALIVWLLFAAFVLVGARILQLSERFSEAMNVTSYISQTVLLLTLFSHTVFPHFLPEWGGAAPVPIRITYTKNAEYLAGLTEPALLLDETDLGFYLLDHNVKRTYFVPRASVALVSYDQRIDLK